MIKAVIFDWGGVLIDEPTEGFMKYCSASLGISVDELKREFLVYGSNFQKGQILENDIWKEVCEKFGVNEPTSPSLWREAIEAVFKDRDNVFKLVAKLRENGYIVGFLSNTEVPTMEYFKDIEYGRYFDEAVFSCVENTVKPEEEIYRILLNKLDIKPGETIFIDDKPEYVEGAERVGIKGIRFENYEKLVSALKSCGVRI